MFQCMVAPAKDSFDDDGPAERHTINHVNNSWKQNINEISTKQDKQQQRTGAGVYYGEQGMLRICAKRDAKLAKRNQTWMTTKRKRREGNWRNYANYVFMIGRHKIVNGIGRRRWLGGGMPGQRGADHGPLVGHVRQLRLSWYIRRYLQRLGQLSVSASPLWIHAKRRLSLYLLAGDSMRDSVPLDSNVRADDCCWTWLLCSRLIFLKSSTNWVELPMQSFIFLAKFVAQLILPINRERESENGARCGEIWLDAGKDLHLYLTHNCALGNFGGENTWQALCVSIEGPYGIRHAVLCIMSCRLCVHSADSRQGCAHYLFRRVRVI